ncbi:MAG: hypothetical protein ACRDHW_12215, partial [Ktedonobacteraceae bacterium]
MKPSVRRILMFFAVSLMALSGVFISVNTMRSHAQSAFPTNLFAPYADITLSGPTLQSVEQSTGLKFYTLAFITNGGGTCNAEWAGTIPLHQTGQFLPHLDSDIQFVRNQGGDIIISFGGEAGQEMAQTCTDAGSLQAQYQRV